MNPCPPNLSLLPWPQQITLDQQGDSDPQASDPADELGLPEFEWIEGVDLRVDDYLRQLFTPASGLRHRVHICMEITAQESGPPYLGMDESYSLTWNAGRVLVRAATTWGGLRACATAYQLLSHAELPSFCRIEDQPRFLWRGLCLDVARHFFPLPTLLQVVEGMALLKMNVLHLHLTDDQAFRFASPGWPALASEQHYSRQQLEQLVAFGSARGIRIVPEIDMPGHVNHWLTAYPEWGLHPVAPTDRFGVHPACLDPTREVVYRALNVLLQDVAEVFPDEYIHLGGDEVSPDWWQQSEAITQFMADNGMASTQDLANYFLQRLVAITQGLGRKPVAWDEVLHPDMPTCLVQNWRGVTTRDQALQLGQDCLVSAPFYLDLNYPADVHYAFDPSADQQSQILLEDQSLEDVRLQHVAQGMAWTRMWREGAVDLVEPLGGASVLGGEACLWSELVDPDTLPTRLWSRLPAVAERLWSSASCRQIDHLYERLEGCWETLSPHPYTHQQQRLAGLGLSDRQIFLLSFLEPIKWYGRLLGEEALLARIAGREMPQARPYRVTTPLGRAVDFLAPESWSAHVLAKSLKHLGWDALEPLRSAVRDCPGPWPDDVAPAIQALGAVNAELTACQRNDASIKQCCDALLALYRPYGEYLPGLIPPIVDWLRSRPDQEGR